MCADNPYLSWLPIAPAKFSMVPPLRIYLPPEGEYLSKQNFIIESAAAVWLVAIAPSG